MSRWGTAAIIGLLTICIGNGGVIWAEQWVPSGIAAVTVAMVPFWMIGIEAFTAMATGSHRGSRRLARWIRRDRAAGLA
jgi:drug/metabolite transporter (DMT)-like permease